MQSETRPQILIVDDDIELVSMLRQYLEREGFAIQTCHDGQAVPQMLSTHRIDLMILDVMLPGRSGLELLRQLVPQHPELGIIMLTARGDAVDRILGLELGADDYLPKPFDPRELSARMRAVLRRREVATEATASAPLAHEPTLALGSLQLDPMRRRVMVREQHLALTAAEFRVLQCLLESRGKPVERETLTERALGRKLTAFDRSIDTHVSNLRRKLERGGAVEVQIQSVRGAGYEILERRE